MTAFASLPLVRALGWGLFHSLWQGTAIGALGAILLLGARHRTSEVRYRLASACLALMVLAFAATVAWLLLPGRAGAFAEGGLLAPVLEAGAGLGWWIRFQAWAAPWMPWLIAAWSVGFCLHLLNVGAGLAWLYGSCLGASRPAPAEWQRRFGRLREIAGIRGPVRLHLSPEVDSLLVLGWLKPVVLVPAAAFLALSPEALEALLAHELAHIRRRDFLANLAQTLAESILFFHPAVWWLSRRIRQEREHCCDDAAVQACGDPILYASALLGLEELRSPVSLMSDLAPAASGGNLMSRIQRILRPHSASAQVPPVAAFLPALALAVGLGLSALSAAETPKPASAAPVAVDWKKVKVRHQPEAPVYPPEAKAQRIQGTVVVAVTIDAEGNVTRATAMSGPPELQPCAVDYARGWTFEPALVKGKAVPAQFKLTMPFRLK